MKVLIVDDNLMDRKLIGCLLKSQFNYNISYARHGFEALSKLNDETFDLMITDIVMPQMEGIELIKKTKAYHPNTQIIAVSGNNPYYLYIAQKLGINYVFTKPLEIDNFIAALKSINRKVKAKLDSANHH